MTRYEQGFMNKCAEYGVDGRAFLEKNALSLGDIPAAGKWIASKVRHPVQSGKRWWQLLRGGSNKVLGKYRKAQSVLNDKWRQELLARVPITKMKAPGEYAALDEIARLGAGGNPAQGVGHVGGRLMFSPQAGGALMDLGDSAQIARELGLVRGTRIGTAAAGTLGIAGLINSLSGGNDTGKKSSFKDRVRNAPNFMYMKFGPTGPSFATNGEVMDHHKRQGELVASLFKKPERGTLK